MKLGSIYAGNLFQNANSENVSNQENKEGEKGSVKNGTIFAGNIKTIDPASPLAKKEKEQKEAIKTILDRFAQEQEIDNSVEEMNQKKEALTAQAAEYKSQMDSLRTGKEQLKELYDVSDDSSEQKNLEVLEKSMDDPSSLTDDEWSQLEGMGPLTEYQKEALSYKAVIDDYKGKYESALGQKRGINSSIESVKLERLKTHPMVDAQKEAQKIMENASKEAIDGMIGEAKDKIDEDMEAAKDKEEKLKEEKKEEEDRIESGRDHDGEAVDTDTVTEAVSQSDTLDQELKNIIKSNKLLEESLKGAVVDQLT